MANKDTLRKAEWAHRCREWLIKTLGGECARCSATFELAIDHVHGRDWALEKFSQAGRVRKYLKEFRAGVELRVLCKTCNGGYNPYR